MRVSCNVSLGETAELGSATSPSKFKPPSPAPPYMQLNSTQRHLQPDPLDNDNALAVLAYAIGHILSIEHSAFLPHSSPLSCPV